MLEYVFYLMIFFLPYIEVPFLDRIFILKLSNIMAVILVLLLLREWFLKKRRITLPLFLPLLIYGTVCFLSAFQGFFLPLEEGLIGAEGRNAPVVYSFVILFWMAFAYVIFWITSNIAGDRKYLVNALKVHFISAGIVSLWGIWTVAGYIMGFDTGLKYTEVYWIVPRLNSTALEPLFFGNYLLSVLPAAVMLYLTGRDILNRNLMLLLVIIELTAFIMTFSTGAWIGLLAAGIFMVGACSGEILWSRIARLAVLMLMIVSGGMVAGSVVYPDITSVPGMLADKYTNVFRRNTYVAKEKFNRVEFSGYQEAGEIKPGDYAFEDITVKNTGTKTWVTSGMNATHLTYTWIDSAGEKRDMLMVRTWLPRDIRPGESVRLRAVLRAPDEPGDYTLQWDMVEEYTGFFQQQKRSLPLSMDVTVRGPRQYYAAEYEVISGMPDTPLKGRKYNVRLKVRNTGTITWNAGGDYPVRLGYRWFGSGGGYIKAEGSRTALPHDIRPGESVLLDAELVRQEGIPANAVLKWDMVREKVVWFSEQAHPVKYHKKTERIIDHTRATMNVESISERWGLWRAGWSMFMDRPFSGVGPGNFSFLYNTYKPDDAVYKYLLPVINNTYLEVLVETGLAGAAAFVFFIFSAVRMFVKGRKSITDPFGKVVYISLMGSLIAIAIQFNLFIGKTLHYFWVVMGLAAACIKLYSRDSS